MTLKRSLKVIANDTIGFPIYDFLLVVNSNYGHKWLPFEIFNIKQQLALTFHTPLHI